MLVSEFIKAKNAIIYKHLGEVLVPEEFIQECPQFPLGLDSDGSMCPYCQAYWERATDFSEGCEGCPLYVDGVSCKDYHRIVDTIQNEQIKEGIDFEDVFKYLCQQSKIMEDLEPLIRKYNRELKKSLSK